MNVLLALTPSPTNSPNRSRFGRLLALWLSLTFLSLSVSSTVRGEDTRVESRLTHVNARDDFIRSSKHQRADHRFDNEIVLDEELQTPNLRLDKLSADALRERIGIHNNIPEAYIGELAPTLDWHENLNGELSASFTVRLTHSHSFRLKMQVLAASRLTIRYSEIGEHTLDSLLHEQEIPFQPIELSRPVSVWSPTVQTGALGIEFVLHDSANLSEFSISLLRYSIPNVGQSSNSLNSTNVASLNQCEGLIDAKCAEFSGLQNKLSAVGRILVEKDGVPVFCTGTLLNSKEPSDDPLVLGDGPAPYLLTSNQCASSQDEADSLEITWSYEHQYCGDSKIDERVESTYGGGELLATSTEHGFSLIRLRNNLPGGLVYSGWRASSLAVPSSVLSIHHPSGGVKKVSSGTVTQHQTYAGITDAVQVEWDNGGTERGSDGAGLFDDNYLVGTLVRSEAFCEQSVSYFSTFASFFPVIRGYLLGDHSDVVENATRIRIPISIHEKLTPGDVDYYQFETQVANRVVLFSEGDTNTLARLIHEGEMIEEDDNGGLDENFLIERMLDPGTYLLQVTGGTDQSAGHYRLRTTYNGATAPTAAPTNVQVERKVGRLEVSWDEISPDGNGGSAITGYRATASNPSVSSRFCSTTANATKCEIPNLTPGLDYAVSVHARNTYGPGPASIPVHAVPLSHDASRLFVAPSNVSATINHSDGSVSVHWDAIPTDSGRAEVISYKAEAIRETNVTSCETTPDSTSCVLTGFEDGATYQLTVFAISAAGNGPRSNVLQITPIHTLDHSNTQINSQSISFNSRTAAFLQIDDVDYFRFSIDSVGSIHLWSEGDVDTYGRLHSSSTDLLSDNDDGQGSNFAIRSVLAPGTYFLQVTERSNTSGYYTLSAAFVADDHSDGRVGATRVDPDSETAGYLAYDDDDYFRIELENPGTLHASTLGDPDTIGFLQSETDDLVSNWDDGPGRNFNLWYVVDPGTYYVRVSVQSGSTGDYLLKTSFDKDDHANSQIHATIIDADSQTSGHLALGDEDYFRFDTSNRGTVHVSTLGDADTIGFLQSETDDLVSNWDDGPGRNFNLWHVIEPGTYYIRVLAQSGSTGDYVLLTSFEKDDHGDGQSSATKLNPNSATEGYIAKGDVDYFRIEISQSGTLSLATNGEVDTFGLLQSETADLDSDSSSGPGNNFHITATVAAGVYFLRVSGEGSSNTGSYTLIALFESEM